jgi:hypothetical protein
MGEFFKHAHTTIRASVTPAYINRIRNYMSKPWFLKMALEAEASPLSAVISRVLTPTFTSAINADSESSVLVETLKRTALE